jgi:hypothetical protein
MNKRSELGLIPASESVNIRPRDTAGFANEVDEVKKYAEAIQSDNRAARRWISKTFQLAIAIRIRPKLAINSAPRRFAPLRSISDTGSKGLSKIAWAIN